MVNVGLQAKREKSRASLIALAAVVALLLLKVFVGLLTGSLAILAQAADSVLDLVATVLAFYAVRVAAKPADAEHPYGHGRVENLTALAETLLLFFTCGWIIYEAVQRLFFRTVPVEANIWAIGVMLLSIAASLWLSTYLMRVAVKYRSQSLEGNALNFRTDVLSSSVVLLGLGLVWLSHHLGPEWAWLAKADAVAALIVALLVLRVSLKLGRDAVSELLDAAPPGLAERIAAAARATAGVEDVGAVRVRQAGADVFVDLAIEVGRSASLEEAHQAATAVERRVSALVDQGDVVVHVDPVEQEGESLPQALGSIAARLGLKTHNVHAHELAGCYFVDYHVEVPPEWTLAEAHEHVAEMEAMVREELPFVSDLHSHIEPATTPAVPAFLEPEAIEDLRDRILAAVEGVPVLHGWHEVYIRPGLNGYDVVLHCNAEPTLSIARAHQLADQAEKRIQAQIPAVGEVLIHVEPAGEIP